MVSDMNDQDGTISTAILDLDLMQEIMSESNDRRLPTTIRRINVTQQPHAVVRVSENRYTN
jgi:hypothetical protein